MIFDKLKRKREYISWNEWKHKVNAIDDVGVTDYFAKKAMRWSDRNV